jgi:hypothetical protein
MKITTGEYEVLYSGTVIGVIDEPIEFQFPKNQGSIKIIIEFKSDDSNTKNLPIELNAINKKTLKMTLINLNDLGAGNTKIINIGNIGGRKLFINYRVYSINELSKTLHYSFYLGKEATNDN